MAFGLGNCLKNYLPDEFLYSIFSVLALFELLLCINFFGLFLKLLISSVLFFFLHLFCSTLFFSVFRMTSLQIPPLSSWVQSFPRLARYSWWALENFSFIRSVFAGLVLFLCFIVLSFSTAEVFHGWSTWIYAWVWSTLSFIMVVYIGCLLGPVTSFSSHLVVYPSPQGRIL